MSVGSLLSRGNAHLLSDDAQSAIRCFWYAALDLGAGFTTLEFNFESSRRLWLAQNASRPLRVGVCGAELAHNSAGRAMTLAEAYEPHAEVAIIGSILPTYGRSLWEPLRTSSIPCHSVTVESADEFVLQAMDLVVNQPFDVVHLSKPRVHNIIFGWLYQLVWGAKIIMDVDDEELGFIGRTQAIDPLAYIEAHGALPPFKNLRGATWTQLAVGLVGQFDGITVSNKALQRRYGGEIIPHVRPLDRFKPSLQYTRACRERWGVPLDKKVVLFYGTPRRHKGIVETAQALAQLQREDVCFVIAGGELEADLQSELDAIEGLECISIGYQPYEDASKVVAVGDVCILLQNVESLTAQFQAPAKLTDALAMGLTVFAQCTPALDELAEQGAFISVTRENLVDKLRMYFESGDQGQGARGRAVFESSMSVESVEPRIQEILLETQRRRAVELDWQGQLALLIKGCLPQGVPLKQQPLVFDTN